MRCGQEQNAVVGVKEKDKEKRGVREKERERLPGQQLFFTTVLAVQHSQRHSNPLSNLET